MKRSHRVHKPLPGENRPPCLPFNRQLTSKREFPCRSSPDPVPVADAPGEPPTADVFFPVVSCWPQQQLQGEQLNTSAYRGPVTLVFAAALAVSIAGCGGSAGAQSGVSPSAIASTAASRTSTSTPSSLPSSSPSGTGEDATPLDPSTAPVVTAAGVTAPNPQPAYATKALDLLGTLAVKGRAPKTGYSRDQFGPRGPTSTTTAATPATTSYAGPEDRDVQGGHAMTALCSQAPE